MAIAKQAGFTQESFDACLKNQKAWDAMESVRQRGMKEFKVESTPTFFVNGTRIVGAVSIEDFAKVIDPYLTGK
jgi:protein-disulfide isomerase